VLLLCTALLEYRLGGRGVAALLPSRQLIFYSASKGTEAVKSCTASFRSATTFLPDHDMPDGLESLTPEHIRAFLLAERAEASPHGRGGRTCNTRVMRPFSPKPRLPRCCWPVDARTSSHGAMPRSSASC
jgi:hypothetical protein